MDAAGAARPAATPGPRRARPIYRVFVSSTWLDLQPERRALMEALNRMEEMRFVGMEFFGNRPDDTHDASIDQVNVCELFVAIIGHRYGSGITEAEYRRARELGLPCFVYFKHGDTARPELTDGDPALAAKLAAFKQDLLRGHTVKDFTRPEELSANATADLHNWVAARWISVEREAPVEARPPPAAPDADRTNVLRLLERIEQDWIQGVLEASLHHKAWLELGLDWREDAVEHPWDRIVVAPNRPIKTLSTEDSITGVFDSAQNTLLVLGEPGAGKTTTVLELARDLTARARASAHEPAPVVLALSTWRGAQKDFADWLIAELGLRYQVPKRVARSWLDNGRLVLVLDGLDEVALDRRAACVEAINAFEQAHHPPGLAVTCRVAEYDALTVKLRLRAAICLQPLTPAQIERYFAAAGAGLDHLRLAMRDDAGLRELARSPLMLSVMAMAWRDAPAMAVRDQSETPIEERRRQLFDAYVQAAMSRRGKTTGGYTVEQTVKWLTWLACRMKENGHTLFAVEQLQPGWLDGARRQFGYFLTTRLLGTIGLALPFLFLKIPVVAKVMVAGVSLALGGFMGAVDFGFARDGWGGRRRASLRFWTLFIAMLILVAGWVASNAGSKSIQFSIIYLVMAGFAFCVPLDVRALDIKPTGSMQWSWRLALDRAGVGWVVVSFIVTAVVLSRFSEKVSQGGWTAGFNQLGGAAYFCGLALAAGLIAIGWRRLRPRRNVLNVALAIALILLGGQIGGVIGGAIGSHPSSEWSWQLLLAPFTPAILFGVFCGFASTLIDPARPQQAGAWFWLRVPVLAFLVIGFVMLIPGLIGLYTVWAELQQSGQLAKSVWAAVGVGAACGLVAFFRFGGFNGAQHFFLRWQLSRSGNLPPKAESFFNHAAQLALLQKVGLGYRFVHALLLEHLAVTKGGAAARGAAQTLEESALLPGRCANERPRLRKVGSALRSIALTGLVSGLGLTLFVMAASLFAHWRSGKSKGAWDHDGFYVGVFMLMFWLAIPVLLLSARWLWSRSWRWLGGGYLALALALAYLAADDPVIRRPISPETVAPAFPGAEKSYEVLMRYGVRHPAAKKFKFPGFKIVASPEYPKAWRDGLIQHRAEIETNWSTLAPVREWITELNAFDRIGDLSKTLSDVEVVSWSPVRSYRQHAAAIASLQAIAGQGDAALATLLPLLEVGCKLETSSRHRFNFDSARLMQNQAVATAQFVLDTTSVSAAARARFAAALVGRSGGPAGARHLFVMRHAEIVDAMPSFGRAVLVWNEIGFDALRRPLDLVGPFVFNRRATLNSFGDLFADLEEFAANREAKKAEERTAEFLAEGSRRLFKNIGASWLNPQVVAQIALRNNERLIRIYWALEDRRTALHTRLIAP